MFDTDDRMYLSLLEGIQLPFYGAHSNMFMLGHMVFEVIEDPNDGYRSSMKDVRFISCPDVPSAMGFF
jgi:hypothetical protein